jgi:signal transduction histidine kinase
MPRSLSKRLTLALGLAVTLALMVMAALVDCQVDHELVQRFDDGLLLRAHSLISLTEVEHGTLQVSAAWTELGASEPKVRYRVRCGDMQLQSPAGGSESSWPWPTRVDHAPRYADLRLPSGALDRGVAMRFTLPSRPDDRDGDRDPRADTAPHACRLLMFQSRARLDDILLAVDGILLATPGFALLALLLVAPLLVRRGLAPLRRLAEQMHRIGPEAPGERLDRPSVTELEPLVERFNEVLARMDAGLARERQFASGLAHETRTRLAELRSLIEVERRFPGRSSAEVLDEIGAIGSELEATVAALLQLTRLESGLEPVRRRPCTVASRVRRQLTQHQEALVRRRLQVIEALDPGVAIWADPALLDVIVGNLIGNGCAYAPPGDRLWLQADARGLRVINRAEQLQAEDLAVLGERFWRKQNDGSHHAGLGLALAHAAARALGMTLGFHLDAEKRLCATLSWPDAALCAAPHPGTDADT